MAHFAKIGLNNKVIQVLYVSDQDCIGADGVENEEIGRQFLEDQSGWPLWVQTSRNTRSGVYYSDDGVLGDQSKVFRGTFAGIGMIWDPTREIFYREKPTNNPSFVWSDEKVAYVCPVERPSVDNETKGITVNGTPTSAVMIKWDETDVTWKAVETSTGKNFTWNTTSNIWENDE